MKRLELLCQCKEGTCTRPILSVVDHGDHVDLIISDQGDDSSIILNDAGSMQLVSALLRRFGVIDA